LGNLVVESVVVLRLVMYNRVVHNGLVMYYRVVNLGMDGMTGLGDDSVEPVMLVSSVVYLSDGTIGLVKHVVALYGMSVAGFVLLLNVSGVRVVDVIFEGIWFRSLGMLKYV
jgi:hypothetical protein